MLSRGLLLAHSLCTLSNTIVSSEQCYALHPRCRLLGIKKFSLLKSSEPTAKRFNIQCSLFVEFHYTFGSVFVPVD